MKHDYNLILRLPRELKSAIEKRAGPGGISDFLRRAAEDRLTHVCERCKGSGRVWGPKQIKK